MEAIVEIVGKVILKMVEKAETELIAKKEKVEMVETVAALRLPLEPTSACKLSWIATRTAL